MAAHFKRTLGQVCLPTAITAILLSQPSAGQGLAVVSTDPIEDAVSVPLQKRVEFLLSKELPAFGTQFLDKFHWTPEDSAVVGALGHDFDGSGDLKVVFFELEHEQNTDVAFWTYGVKSDDGSTLNRPVTLNYTTASTNGTRTVSGTAAFGTRALSPPSATRALMQRLVQRSLQKWREDQTGYGKASGKTMEFLTEAKTNIQDIEQTVVFLLDAFTLEETFWRIWSATPVSGTGAFALDNVRDGTYWPLAISFADNGGEVVGSYGFYDANGDLDPDPVVVSGNTSAVDLTLYPFESATAATFSSLAWDRASQIALDQRLIEIKSHEGPAVGQAFQDGTALAWRYSFYSPSLNLRTLVVVDPIEISVSTLSPQPGQATQLPLPDPFTDSDVAVTVADAADGTAFKNQYGDPSAVRVIVEGGDLSVPYRPPQGTIFWRVTYMSPVSEPFQSIDVFIDIDSGTPLPVELVRLEASSHGNQVNLRWTTASETSNVGFEVQTLRDELWFVLGFVPGAGTSSDTRSYSYEITDLSPGEHEFRLRQINADGTFAVSPSVEVIVELTETVAFSGPYPNPFVSATSMTLSAARRQEVRVEVFDVLGRLVVVLFEGVIEANTTDPIRFDGVGLSTGTYFVRASGDTFAATRQVVLAR